MRAALILSVATASATARTPAIDDERVYALAGREAELHAILRDSLVSDPAVQRAVRRVGTPAGCAAMFRAERRLGDRYDLQFKPLLVAATRAGVPSVVLASARTGGLDVNPALGFHRPTVRAALDRTAAPILAAAKADLHRYLAAELATPMRLAATGRFAPYRWSEAAPGSLHGACAFYLTDHRDAVFAGLPAGVK